MKDSFLFIFFLGITSFACPQEFQFKSYTDKDGLSNNDINAVLQDSKGFLWVATSNGLDRFDGNSFDAYYNDPYDSTTIAGNYIQCLFLDRRERMWIGTNEGISLYHPISQTFSNYAPDTTALPAIGITFQALCEDERGNLWVGTKNDLLIFNPETKQFASSGWAEFATNVALANSNRLRVVVLGVIKRGNEDLWILSTYGLFSVNTNRRSFEYFPYPKIGDYYGSELRYADDKGNVWISLYSSGLLCFHSKQGTWSEYHTPEKYAPGDGANCIIQYGGDTLLYCSSSSIIFFDSKDGKILSAVPCRAETISSTGEESICKNVLHQNNFLWVGTNYGLIKLTPRESLFHFYAVTKKDLVTRVFRSAFLGKILFSEWKGCYLQENDGSITALNTTINKNIETSHQYFAEGEKGIAYLNDDEHFYVYDEARNVARPVLLPGLHGPVTSFDFRNIVIDRTGIVWIRSLSRGILRYRPATGELSFENDIPLSGSREINSLYYDSLTHCLWIAEEFNGIFVYNIEKKSAVHYLLNSVPSQRGAAVLYITGDGRGRVWMTSLLSGILEYDNVSKKFLHYTSHDGLLSDKTSWLCLDNRGYLWICTDAGLSVMDTATKKFINYNSRDGYPATLSLFLSRDNFGNVYMPSGNGYFKWNDSVIIKQAGNGILYLRKAQLPNRNLPVNSQYRLSYSETNIQLLFGWLSFSPNIPAYIEYRLNDNPWVTTNLHSYISFASLAPGHYDLYVRIKNAPAGPFHLELIIKPPLWQRWWFLLLAFLLVAVVAFSLLKSRLNAIRRESSLQHQVIESEMSALRSQMNPHFVFNILNSINSYIIENKSQQASDYLTDFSRLMRIILEHSRKKLITLEDEILALRLYLELELKRLEGSFDYRISVQPELDISSVEVPPLIVQPFVENAIWHGLRNKKTAGHIDISMEKKEDEILISIIDNGIGRVEAAKIQKIKEKTSFGTAATIRRIRLSDPGSKVIIEDLYNSNELAYGTRVTIFLKIKNY